MVKLQCVLRKITRNFVLDASTPPCRTLNRKRLDKLVVASVEYPAVAKQHHACPEPPSSQYSFSARRFKAGCDPLDIAAPPSLKRAHCIRYSPNRLEARQPLAAVETSNVDLPARTHCLRATPFIYECKTRPLAHTLRIFGNANEHCDSLIFELGAPDSRDERINMRA